MKIELSNEEIARVFAMYMPCDIYKPGTKLIAVDVEDGEYTILEDDGFNSRLLSFQNTSPKLLLTPLEKITDEHAIEVLQWEYKHILSGYETLEIKHNDKGRIHIRFRWKHSNPALNLNDGYSYSSWATNFNTINSELFQYLISKGYAVPLFFGVGHWANGKTAIELGIAIEVNTRLNKQ